MKKNLNRDLFVIEFVRFVSSPQTHAKRVRKIKKTLQICPDNLNKIQWLKLWRGFYYSIWYTEMRKGGEELIEVIGSFQNGSFLLSGFKSLMESWSGIDSFRIDKYMFLIRIMLRNVLKQQITSLIKKEVLFENNNIFKEYKKNQKLKIQDSLKLIKNEKDDSIKNIPCFMFHVSVVDYIVSITSYSVGLFLHVCDIYLEELQKCVSELAVEDSSKALIYYEMVIPFAKQLSFTNDDRIRTSIRENIFDKLIDDLIINEAVSIRIDILNKFLTPLIEIACRTESGKNRICLYRILKKFRSKFSSLNSGPDNIFNIKRKIVGIDHKTKKIKFETVTTTPFVRSIVPLPLI